MAFKFVAFLACIAVARAGYLAQVAQPVLAKTEDYDPNPQYNFGYDVQDAISGDNKNQVESRNGDVVQGQYSLNDADGYRRIVDYTADPINGFNAVVHREPLGSIVKTVAAAPAIVKAAPAPIAYAAAPTLLKTAAPAAYVKTAPAHLAYAAAPAAYLKAAPAAVAYAAAPTLIKSAPTLSYTAGPALVKTSYSSPIISYAY